MAASLTVADRVARKAVYGYATDVISAAVYAYAILPNRWRKLIRDARAQRQLERRAWEALAAVRRRLAQTTAARAVQRAFRHRQAEKELAKINSSRLIVEKAVRRWLQRQRGRQEAAVAATRARAVEEWVRRVVIRACWTRRGAARRIQCLWRVHRIHQLHLEKEWQMRVSQFRVSSSRNKINRWIQVMLFRREQHQEREREQVWRARNQAARCIQTRWRRHHQRSLRRYPVMTVETVPGTRADEENVPHVDAAESELDLHQALFRRAMMRRQLEQFLRAWITKSRIRQFTKSHDQSDHATRVINHWMWRCIIKRRRECPHERPESNEDTCEDSTGRVEEDEPLVENTLVEDARVVGLSGRIPIRPPKLMLSSSVAERGWERTSDGISRHAAAAPLSSSELREHKCSINGNRVYSSSPGSSSVTTRPSVLPPVRVPHRSTKSTGAHSRHRPARAKSYSSDNQAVHQAYEDPRVRTPSQTSAYIIKRSSQAATMMAALPPLQRTASVAGTRLLNRFEPKRNPLPTLVTTPNQGGES